MLKRRLTHPLIRRVLAVGIRQRHIPSILGRSVLCSTGARVTPRILCFAPTRSICKARFRHACVDQACSGAHRSCGTTEAWNSARKRSLSELNNRRKRVWFVRLCLSCEPVSGVTGSLAQLTPKEGMRAVIGVLVVLPVLGGARSFTIT